MAVLSHLLLLALGTFSVSASKPQPKDTYDYIVVGSGPGGGPLAVNLAKAGKSVLLLEAGSDETQSVNATNLFLADTAVNDPATRWDFFVKHFDDSQWEREKKFAHTTWRTKEGGFYVGLDPPRGAKRLGVWYPRAGTLGGCSQHNAGASFLPQDSEWDYIAEITGDKTWLAKNMRKYLIRLENNTYTQNDPTHGYDGYLQLTAGTDASWVHQPTDEAAIFAAIGKEVGFEQDELQPALERDMNNADPDRDYQTGPFTLVQHMSPTFIRSSAGTLVHDTVKSGLSTLTLRLNSLVTKVLLDKPKGKNGKPEAVGVEYIEGEHQYAADPRYNPKKKGKTRCVYARKEVIIAGGVFNTPQILKLSGIGPAKELKKFKIPVLVDLPGVGERMSDNYENSIITLANREFEGWGGAYSIIHRSSQSSTRDIFFWCGRFAFEGFWPGYPDSYGPRQFSCAMVHMGSKSRAGYVRLRSSDPRDTPEINQRLFQIDADKDLTAMHEFVELIRDALGNVNSTIAPFSEIKPCPADKAPCSVAEEKEFLRSQAYTHHATSTAQIGSDRDPLAVLDSRFRVRGVKNLRVVDGSVFPYAPGGFPVLPTFMLAEKATEDILTGR